jgi:hypothetical protein
MLSGQEEELFTYLSPFNGDAQDCDTKTIPPNTLLPLHRHSFIESVPVGIWIKIYLNPKH